MANNASQTIDPGIAGYAANDPAFALGLMLGRGIANAYEERGIRKLNDKVGSPFDMQNGGTTTGYTVNQNGGDPTPQQAPIWSANSTPTLQNPSPYKIDVNGGDQPLTDNQRANMQNFIQQAQAAPTTATPPAQGTAAQGAPSTLQDRIHAILYDPDNKWVQSANRGDVYNRMAQLGYGNGNPYYGSQMNGDARLAAQFAQRNTPTASVDPQTGAVTMNQPQGYANPLDAIGAQINTGTVQPLNTSGMTVNQLQAFMNGETPQQSAVLDAVQAAQQQKAAQNVNPSEAGQGNSGTAQPDTTATSDKQGEDTSQQAPIWNAPATAPTPAQNTPAPAQTAPAATPQQAAPAQNGVPRLFSTQEWIARVWDEGRREGRPDSQIQAVIDRTLPMAQAAEENSKRNVLNYYTNRILRGDETTGGKNLIPTYSNYDQVIPKYYDAVAQMAQVDPVYTARFLQMLPMPTAMTAWNQDIGTVNNNLNEQRSYRMSDYSMKQNQQRALWQNQLNRENAVWNHNMQTAWKNEELNQKANQISEASGGQITPQQAMLGLLTGGLGGNGGRGGSGSKSGGSSSSAPKMTAGEQQAYNGYSDVLNDLAASMSGSDGYRSAAISKAEDFMKSDDWSKVPTAQRHVVEQAVALGRGISLAKAGAYKEASQALGQLTDDAWSAMGISDPDAFVKGLGLQPSWVHNS